MIVAEVGEEYELVTQGDHAALAAELLSLLRIPTLIEHPRRALLIRATREHDRGWRGADAAPRIDPLTGRPTGYRDIPGELRREIWSEACEARSGDEPYVRLLIVLHGLYLHSSHGHDRPGQGERDGSEEWDDWLSDLRELESELLAECALDAAEAAADHEWLALADACSLAMCERLDQSFHSAGFEGTSHEDVLHLAPFPMAGRTTFAYPCRRLRRQAFESDRALGGALALARWRRRSVAVAPNEV